MGLVLLINTATHPFQFRCADIEEFFCGLPPTLVNWWPSWVINLLYLWSSEENVPRFVRGIFPNEYVSFKVFCGVRLGGRHPHGFRSSRWENRAVAGMCGLPQPPTGVFSRHSPTFVRALLACPVRLDSAGKTDPSIAVVVDMIACVDGLLTLTQHCSCCCRTVKGGAADAR